jgi:hypothetical protein
MIALRGSRRRDKTGVGSIALPPLEDGPVKTALEEEEILSGTDGDVSGMEANDDGGDV